MMSNVHVKDVNIKRNVVEGEFDIDLSVKEERYTKIKTYFSNRQKSLDSC